MKLDIKLTRKNEETTNTKVDKIEYAATAAVLYIAAGVLMQVGDACIDLLFGIDKK